MLVTTAFHHLNMNIPLFEKYPNLIEEMTRLCDDFSQYKTVNQIVIQGILGCSKNDVTVLVGCFLEHELIKKFDISDSYVVMKDNFDGLKVLLVCFRAIHELLSKSKEI